MTPNKALPKSPFGVLFTCLFFLGLVFAGPALAVDLKGSFKQGGMVIGKTAPENQVFLDDNEVLVADDGRFVFGFGRDADPVALLKIVTPGGKVEEELLSIEPQKYDIERVDGLPERTVTIPEEERLRRGRERALVGAARQAVSGFMDWAQGFQKPAEGRISGVYGSQRILNGEPRWPHYGLDIAGGMGAPVKAPAGGVVRLAQKDFLLEGGIIIIDHGFGVISSFLHLSKVNVEEGQRVEKGAVIGAIGMTGRASGPHLDWRVNWGDVRLDPALVLEAFSGEGG